MTRIIPSILVPTEQEFRKQVSLAAAFASYIQIDVLDGTLFPQKTFSDPAAIAKMGLTMPFEAHLMINHPEKAVKDWIRAGAQRIIVHIEAEGDCGLALERILNAGRVPGLAIDPETELGELRGLMPLAHHLLIMGVHPGKQGQAFDMDMIDRVRATKLAYPQVTIGVDGGVGGMEHLARRLAQAGADDLVVGSSLWRSHDPAKTYRQIANDANSTNF